jgi:hypothetical protein
MMPLLKVVNKTDAIRHTAFIEFISRRNKRGFFSAFFLFLREIFRPTGESGCLVYIITIALRQRQRTFMVHLIIYGW